MRFLSFAALSLLLLFSSCILTSGQIVVSIDLPRSISVSDQNGLTAIQVDLNANAKYADHKNDLEQIVDAAFLGTVTHNGFGDTSRVTFWMTREITDYQLATEVEANGIPLWGPFPVQAQESKRIDWNQSVRLLDDDAVSVLADEVKGDGRFTLYALDETGIFQFDVSEGALALVLDTGL